MTTGQAGGRFDVAVVGMGPVGAVLTGLLGRRGLRVAAIERERDVFPLPRAAHIDHTGLRTLQELGLLEELLVEMVPNAGLELLSADLSLLARLPGDQRTVSGLPASMYFHQPGFDRALRRHAAELPSVDVRLGTEVTGVVAGDDSVTLSTAGDEGTADVVASWVVGCDGALSPIREAGGAGLEDLGFHEDWIAVDLLLSAPVATLPDASLQVCDPARPYVAVPMPGLRFRFEFMVLPGERGDDLATPESVERLIAPWIPPGVAEIERAAVYRFHGLLAERWRSQRVLLAGDAAHQMPPFLGQGMCSGIRDAANLAWKLDHVVRFGASDALLDTYEAERKPHVRHVIETAIAFGKAVCELDPALAAERDRRMLADDAPPERRLRFTLREFDRGPLVLEGGGNLFLQPPGGEQMLDDVVGQRFLVLCRDAPGADAEWWASAAGALVATLDDLDDAAGTLRAWLDRRDADFAVVRPDRFVLGTGRDLAAITAPVRGLVAGG
jgi:3-(3-hydroxy-phenyl)propionate hydroxylase